VFLTRLTLILWLLHFEPLLFAASLALGCLTIVFDGIGIGLIVVLMDGIRASNGTSPFSSLPLLHGVMAHFSALDSATRLQLVAALLVALAVARGTVMYARTIVQRLFEIRTDVALRRMAFGRFMNGPLAMAGDQVAAWQYNILSNFAPQSAAAAGRIASVGASAFAIGIAIIYMTLISSTLTALALLLLGLVALSTHYHVIERAKRAGTALNRFMVDFNQFMLESIFGLFLIRAFAREVPRTEEFAVHLDRQARLTLDTQRWNSLSEPLFSTVVMIAIAVLILAGSILINDPASQIPSIMLFVMVLARMIGPVASVNEGLTYLGVNADAIKTMREVHALPLRNVSAGSIEFEGVHDTITFEDVTVSFPDRANALDGLSLEIRKGAFLAVVGPSGSGKSTFIRVLAKLIEPSSGRVLVNGIDLRMIATAPWRSRIGLVPQEAFLFNETIAANLRLGRPEATDAELIAAAKAAHAHDFIAALPKGYQTIVGDRGSLLSGGQQQRLSIARALLIQPDIIIMDEATSNLDSESEREIRKALDELAGRQTLIVVAHRLSTIQSADEIVVISGGAVAERGTHATLMERGGVYARLYQHHDLLAAAPSHSNLNATA
jgi:ABC-type multidrug transport system fused ATPase/permease subunit